MNPKTWRFFHKWLAIGVGIFILSWTISGIIMVLPDQWFSSRPVKSAATASYRDAVLSPQQALEKLDRDLGQTASISNMGMRKIQDRLFYAITLNDGSYHLIDAKTGEPFKMSPEYAEQLVRNAADIKTGIAVQEILSSHDLLYPFGVIPVYRIRFDSDPGSIYYVSTTNGEISKSTLMTRGRAIITSFHTFEPVKFIVANDAFREYLLIFFSLIAIFTAITGYYLAVQPSIRRRTRSKHVTSSQIIENSEVNQPTVGVIKNE